jgi:hypothetical protein
VSWLTTAQFVWRLGGRIRDIMRSDALKNVKEEMKNCTLVTQNGVKLIV